MLTPDDRCHVLEVLGLAHDLRSPTGQVHIGETLSQNARLVQRDPADVVQERGIADPFMLPG